MNCGEELRRRVSSGIAMDIAARQRRGVVPAFCGILT